MGSEEDKTKNATHCDGELMGNVEDAAVRSTYLVVGLYCELRRVCLWRDRVHMPHAIT
jgi:hypothetical protein